MNYDYHLDPLIPLGALALWIAAMVVVSWLQVAPWRQPKEWKDDR